VDGGLASGAGDQGDGGGDNFPEKLVKYVPAEAIAFYAGATAAIGDKRAGIIALLAAGVAGTLIYDLARGTRQNTRWYFYVLACVAFVSWALGSSAATDKALSIDEVTGSIILGVTVFLVPGIDELISRLAYHDT
jgi:hypothetical protein